MLEVAAMDLSVLEDIKTRLARGYSPLEIATRLKIPLEQIMMLRMRPAEADARPDLSGGRGKAVDGAPEGWLMPETEADALLRRSRSVG